MDRLVYHNDRMLDLTEAMVAPTIAGLLYGWGVFTTLRVYNGKVFAFDYHWERLLRHSEKARVPVPLEWEEARRALNDLIAANSVEQGRARITVLKGEAGFWRGASTREADIVMFTSSEAFRALSNLALTISPYRVLSGGPLANVKRTAMIENLLAFEEAHTRNFDEAIMFNERGEIVSATAANIFWVQGDEVFTPSLATGCIAGITRRLVHEIATRYSLHIVEGSFTTQRLLEAREIFLTSTAREITIVSSFDVKEYNRREARIAKLISREFQKMTRDAKI
ncbi:MAG TPA: aminotransferase class IV [Blastocatellia bacterium]|nr:aminotransferase class IV [Blastocatellia bacterium]